MSADYNDILARLQIQASQPPQPSFAGLTAPQDPQGLQAVIAKLKQQQVLDQANAPTGGQYGFLHDAGKSAFNSIGSSLGGQLAAYGNGLPQAPQGPQQAPYTIAPAPAQDPNAPNAAATPTVTPNPGATPQQSVTNMILAGRAYNQALIKQGIPPDQAKVTTLSKMVEWGVPGADEQLVAAQEAAGKNAATAAETAKNTSQGKMDAANILNQQDEQKNRAFQQANTTAKDTWTTVGQGGGYIVQKNGLGEIKTSKNQDAATTQAASVTPDGLASILDYFHQNNKMPANLPKGVVGKAWEAEAQYQQQTGNIAASYAAQAASTKANTDALVQTQKSLSATSTYMATMDKNISKAEELSKQLDFGDVKKLNGAYQSWLSGTSDPKYAAYNLYFSSVASEFAKIKSGSFGNTPVSDSLQHQAMEDLNKQAGGLAPQALFDAVRTEGTNRVTSLQAERDELAGRIGKGGGFRPAGQPQGVAAAPQQPAGAAAAPQPAPSQYKEGQIAVNPQTGQTMTFTKGQWK